MPEFSDSIEMMSYMSEGPFVVEYVRYDAGQHVVKFNSMMTGETEVKVDAASNETPEPGQALILITTKNAGNRLIKAL
ncbi:hypothetical protein NDA01_03395 [Trichocoleus desertorum AS-A10]|uniref:hypothetical protein n=1 Tax=Trichocoleus desertorum TaxID=1481672 RepID=UPI003298BEED